MVACTSSNVGNPDGSVMSTDTMAIAQGLIVPFTTKSPIPGEVKDEIAVSRVLFRLAHLRVIGDAGPGDTRTSQDHFSIEWKAGMAPSPLTFADAPAGLYSKVSIRADGETIADSYEIEGTVMLEGDEVAFLIRDREPLEISIDTDVALDPGKTASVSLRLELDSALEDIDFSELPTNQGTLELATDDRQMPKFRNRMRSALVSPRARP